MVVAYGAATVTGGQSPVSLACTPASGSLFPLGATTVTCTATDALQRVSACTTTVTVTSSPRLTVTRFVAFGDSITAGEDGNALSAYDPWAGPAPLASIILVGSEYPRQLQGQLQSRYLAQSPSVVNAGVRGERAGDVETLTRFSRDVLGGGYQVVLLLEGANDLVDAFFDDPAAMQAALDNLRSMARQARSAGLKPFIATLPPQNPNAVCVPRCRGMAASLVVPYNDRIRSLAASEAVPVVDVYQAFGGDLTLLSTDGLHPNAQGYTRIADAFFQAVRATLE